MRNPTKSVETLVEEYKESLGDISRELTNRIYPLTNLPEKLHHHQIAYAIKAIDLARELLRDVKPIWESSRKSEHFPPIATYE